MTLKIRLRRQGKTNRPFYRLVVAEGQNPRDGKYIENLGWYNPVEQKEEKMLLIKGDRVEYWLERGAQLTEKAKHLVARAAPEVIDQLTKREIGRKAKKRARGKGGAAA